MPKDESVDLDSLVSARGRTVEVTDPDWTDQLYALASAVLDAAYAGELSTDWRERLQSGGEGPLTRVVLGCLPVCSNGEWEPYAAAGRWDRALDAWWNEYLGLVDHYFRVVDPGSFREREYRAIRDRITRRQRMMHAHMRPPPHYWSEQPA